MLNPIKRSGIGERTPLFWQYPAPFDKHCSVLCEVDDNVVICNGGNVHIVSKPGIVTLDGIPVDDKTHIYFVSLKSYPLIFGIQNGNVLIDTIIIRVVDPVNFLNALFESKSIVTRATTEIFIMQSLNEAVSVSQNSITKVNENLIDKGFIVSSWRCHDDGE